MRAVLALLMLSCRAPEATPDLEDPIDASAPRDAEPTDAEPTDAEPIDPIDASPLDADHPLEELEIEFLGVGGFAMSFAGDRVLTPPFYSNPPLPDVLTGDVRADHAAMDRFLDPASIEGTKAILVGHAHYDHLMDVPYLFTKTPEAHLYGNVDTKHLLAAFAPDRPGCPTSTSGIVIPRERVVAVNAPTNDRVDYRMCAEPQGSCTGSWDGGEGEWIEVPSSNVRIRALCSQHPDQFLIFHLGGGCVDDDQCEPPARASDWREGSTVAYLIDFLDPIDRTPIFRVYYQDAPTEGPVGYPHPDLLVEKQIDVALLCVGNYDQVPDQPQHTIAALSPRYVIAGHWEDFFRSPDEPLQDIPFLDVEEYVRRMNAALPDHSFKPNPGEKILVRSSTR